MTDQGNGDGRNKSKPGESLFAIWGAIGFVIGASLAAKYVYSIGYTTDDDLPWPQGIIMVSLFIGPTFLLGWIAEQLSKEVLSGNSTWATYWTTMVGITVPALAVAGITTFEDVLDLFNNL
ncbi:hypothetical protein [Nonomuraea glycinis]|uniref:hypothetical protein n=1 Tax=Nonomuraea glycinis TaxID=2047744 RepID=UPI002E10FADA|nr:hypothetical protein OHA68_17895 [Nonomuraea glycinis]